MAAPSGVVSLGRISRQRNWSNNVYAGSDGQVYRQSQRYCCQSALSQRWNNQATAGAPTNSTANVMIQTMTRFGR